MVKFLSQHAIKKTFSVVKLCVKKKLSTMYVKYSYCVSCHISHRTNVMNKIRENKEKKKKGKPGHQATINQDYRAYLLYIIFQLLISFCMTLFAATRCVIYHVLGSINIMLDKHVKFHLCIRTKQRKKYHRGCCHLWLKPRTNS